MSETEFLHETHHFPKPLPQRLQPTPDDATDQPINQHVTKSTSAPNLRKQISIPLAILGIIGSVVLAAVVGWVLKTHIEKAIHFGLQSAATNAAQQLSEKMRDRTRFVSELAKSIAASSPQSFEQPSSAQIPSIWEQLAQTQSHFGWMDIADVQGKVTLTSDTTLSSESVTEAPWFLKGSELAYVSDVYTHASSTAVQSARYMDFAAPVEANSAASGVLVIHTLADWVQDALRLPAQSTTQEIELFVFDRAGSLIFSPENKLSQWLAFGQSLPVQPQRNTLNHHIFGGSPAAAQWKDSSQPFYTSVIPLPALNASSDLGWLIVARQSVASANPTVYQGIAMTLLAGLLLTALVVWLTWWRTGKISEELDTLTQSTGKLLSAEGPNFFGAPFTSKETVDLSQSIQSMGQQLLATHSAMAQEIQQRTQELNDANRELDRQASTDTLTGLLNRRGFDAQIQFAMSLARRSGRPLCFMTLDIDHFKKVNEHYGNEVGDLVLKSVATQLRARLRDSDIIARFGGEEFMVLLPDTPPEAAQRIARELLYSIEHHRWPLVGTLTLSAGITALRPTLQNGTEDSDEGLLHRSEEAMQKSKDAGRNQVHFTP